MLFLENAKKLAMYGVDLHQAKVGFPSQVSQQEVWTSSVDIPRFQAFSVKTFLKWPRMYCVSQNLITKIDVNSLSPFTKNKEINNILNSLTPKSPASLSE